MVFVKLLVNLIVNWDDVVIVLIGLSPQMGGTSDSPGGQRLDFVTERATLVPVEGNPKLYDITF